MKKKVYNFWFLIEQKGKTLRRKEKELRESFHAFEWLYTESAPCRNSGLPYIQAGWLDFVFRLKEETQTGSDITCISLQIFEILQP